MVNKETKERILLKNSPVSNSKDYLQYIKSLDKVIDDKEVYNVGIIAPYGSGKSSFVKSFFDYYPERQKKLCYISLASFCEEEEKDINNVEKSILEQIIFKRSFSPFSRSRIKRLHFRVPFIILLSLLMITSIALVVCSILEFLNKLPYSNGSNFYLYSGFSALSIFATLILVLYKANITKIGFRDIEVEFNNKTHGSFLNTFVDEVINYCYETENSYFVFEDIDRFKSVDLLLKLREINWLINENESISNKVTFIYCIRDGLFKEIEDKPKFFDFIISLVPVFNPHKGRELVKKAISDNNDEDLIISDIAAVEMTYFVKEIRVLNVILNDYITYKDVLGISKIDNDKLFAMMVYKNICPNDFLLLQQNDGILYETFNNYKMEAIENASSSINEKLQQLLASKEKATSEEKVTTEIKRLTERINGILAIHGESKASVPAGYVNNVGISGYGDIKGLYIQLNVSTLYGFGTSYKYLSIESIKNYLDGRTPYECEIDIKEKNKQYYDSLIQEQNAELNIIKNKNVKELILEGHYNVGALDKIKENDFLYFAIRNGYIDESYFKFSGKPDVAMDNEFVNKVLNNEAIEPDYPIQNPHLVISRLAKNRFSTPFVLNYALIDELLSSKGVFADKKQELINYLLSRDSRVLKFLSLYFVYGKESEVLINILYSKNHTTIVRDMVNCDGADDRGPIYFIQHLMRMNNGEQLIVAFNKNNEIKDYLENYEHVIETFYLAFDNDNDFVSFIKKVKVSAIKKIDDMRIIMNERMKGVFREIFKNNLLEINPYNLSVAANSYFAKEKLNLQCLIECNNKAVSDFYLANISKTIDALSDIGYKIVEEQNIVEQVLLDNTINVETKSKYIGQLENKIDFVSGLTNDLYQVLLVNNALKPSWSSLHKISLVNGIDFNVIANFISINIDNMEGTISDASFAVKVINSDPLNKQDIGKICDFIKVLINADNISNVDKKAELISQGIITSDKNLLVKCKSNKTLVYRCLEKNNDLIKELTSIFASNNDYLELIKSEDINEIVKLLVAQSYSNILLPLLDDESRSILKNSLINNKDSGIISPQFVVSFINAISDENDKQFLADSLTGLLSDKQIVKLVQLCDSNLYSLLISNSEKVTSDISSIDHNYWFRLLESRTIVSVCNKRINKCNIRTKKFNAIVNS